jgi:hypothetical protein
MLEKQLQAQNALMQQQQQAQAAAVQQQINQQMIAANFAAKLGPPSEGRVGSANGGTRAVSRGAPVPTSSAGIPSEENKSSSRPNTRGRPNSNGNTVTFGLNSVVPPPSTGSNESKPTTSPAPTPAAAAVASNSVATSKSGSGSSATTSTPAPTSAPAHAPLLRQQTGPAPMLGTFPYQSELIDNNNPAPTSKPATAAADASRPQTSVAAALSADVPDAESTKKKIAEEKKDVKRAIIAWNKKFVEENGRDPTKQERDKNVGQLYKKYRQVSEIINPIFFTSFAYFCVRQQHSMILKGIESGSGSMESSKVQSSSRQLTKSAPVADAGEEDDD